MIKCGVFDYIRMCSSRTVDNNNCINNYRFYAIDKVYHTRIVFHPDFKVIEL